MAGLYLTLRKIADGPGIATDHAPPRTNVKPEETCDGSGIVLLGQNIEDEFLPRLPLLITREDREPFVLPAESLTVNPLLAVEGLGGPIPHGDIEHVVNLAGHRLARLDQDVAEGRGQMVVEPFGFVMRYTRNPCKGC